MSFGGRFWFYYCSWPLIDQKHQLRIGRIAFLFVFIKSSQVTNVVQCSMLIMTETSDHTASLLFIPIEEKTEQSVEAKRLEDNSTMVGRTKRSCHKLDSTKQLQLIV